MKFSTVLTATFAASVIASPAPVSKRHYTFPSVGGADWSTVRQTENWQNNNGLGDVTSDQIRCYQRSTKGASGTTTVAAGGSVSFKVSPDIFHPGPIQLYMAKVTSGSSITTWDGKGEVWFKIYSEKASVSSNGYSWASLNSKSVTANIPKSLPAGDYLLRIEHIALHMASTAGNAQFYISCAQLKVTGGGSGTPSPLVSFPGAYKATDPGIKVNIYNANGAYVAPGPAVWQG